ncbi:MAG: thioredoxin family protein, partial [Bacteroidales bacterium]|nr:thioredoxin family protein [Bacteroidales bacterium]
MRTLSILIISLFFFILNSSSQILNPVKWEFDKRKINEKEYELHFKAVIDEKWHIYAQDPNGGMNPTSFIFEENPEFQLKGKVIEPVNYIRKYDTIFNMEYNLYSDVVIFKQNVKLLSDNALVKGYVEFFSCDDQRCLPPKEVEFEFKLITDNSQAKITKEEKVEKGEDLQVFNQIVNIEQSIEPEIETSKITEPEDEMDQNGKRGLLAIFIISFLGGLGALLTPCVYPIIPLTVSFFMRGETKKRESIFKGLVFGISIILIYTFIGLITGLLRIDLTKLAAAWIANLVFFLIFIVFALSFFGMFELVLPSGWANKIDSKADKGGIIGSFFMALATVIISFSCTGPIVGVLLGKSLQGEILQPVFGMFAFSFAFALPFTLLAIFPGVLKNMPKSGGWLNSVKVFFAFILLAFSLKFLSNIDQVFHLQVLTRNVFISIWITLFILLGFYLLGIIKFLHDSEVKFISIPRFMIVIASFAFAVYMIPGLFGAPLKGISYFLPPKAEYSTDLTNVSRENIQNQEENQVSVTFCGNAKYSDFLTLPHGLKGYFDFEEGIKCAKELNKPVLLDFKGHTCTNCKAMEEKVWSDPEVLKRLKNNFVIIALYVDDRTKLPEDEWIVSSNDGKQKKTIGKINADFQITNYKTNALPYYVIT